MSLEANAAGHYPQIAPTAHVHPSAALIGRVYIGDRAFVGPNAVIRADEPGSDGTIEPIIIGESVNVQDGVIIHALGGTGVTIGERTSIAHAAVIHGPCRLGAGCFVGFHSVVFDVTLQDGVVVMHQALVEGVDVPAGLLVPSMTSVRNQTDVHQLESAPSEVIAFVEKVASVNVRLAEAGTSQQPRQWRLSPTRGRCLARARKIIESP